MFGKMISCQRGRARLAIRCMTLQHAEWAAHTSKQIVSQVFAPFVSPHVPCSLEAILKITHGWRMINESPSRKTVSESGYGQGAKTLTVQNKNQAMLRAMTVPMVKHEIRHYLV